MRRKGSGDSFSGSATVAAGGKSTSEHQADVKVIATDNDDEPLAGISVDAPEIQNGDGVSTDASISPSSTTTDSSREADFTFTPGDIVGNVTLEMDSRVGLGSADIEQDWTQLSDENSWDFDVINWDSYR